MYYDFVSQLLYLWSYTQNLKTQMLKEICIYQKNKFNTMAQCTFSMWCNKVQKNIMLNVSALDYKMPNQNVSLYLQIFK